MAALRRLVAVYLVLVAVAVVVQYLATQFYDPTLAGAGATVWRILDPLMVVGMVPVMLIAYARKRHASAMPADPAAQVESLKASLVLYYSAALFLVLLWNWIGFQWVDPPNDVPLLWTVIDTTVPLLLAATAHRLWHKKS